MLNIFYQNGTSRFVLALIAVNHVKLMCASFVFMFLVVDSKCDYPAACNAMETLLVHRDLIKTSFLDRLLKALREKGVSVKT